MAELEKRPSKDEDEYFAREDVEKLRKLAFEQKQALAAHDRETLRKLHHMKCPNCGLDLHMLAKANLEVPTCFNCNGVWLQAGVLDLLTQEKHPKHSLVRMVLNIFKREILP